MMKVILSATSRNLGFESSPFKITQQFVDIMVGIQNNMYGYYKILVLQGSQLNCFSKENVTLGLRERFHLNITDEQLKFNVENMIESSLNSLTTRVYDTFQYYINGTSK
ncbi:unnamed protein product [Adineta steineri]|uniref:Uncharacterized protein n=1 Tax=Adineta steineri TaxID=433720 RepID=A0A814B5W5_9BILA|nr:unnamed protein product [Adineta steineri]CAF1150202.1 unnamed protein product [Adineta steineri]CAF3868757.1 unnamed protein product [Adineta steineri]CAF3975760.1 unnamed protein product [Adineta steineri]